MGYIRQAGLSGREPPSTLERMLRLLFVASTLVLPAVLLSCGAGSSEPAATGPKPSPSPTVHVIVSPPARPTNVPAAAIPVVETSDRGSITPQVSSTPVTSDLRELTQATCSDGLLTLLTSQETIYAQLSCDLFSADQFNPLFVGKPVAIKLIVEKDRFHIFIDTIDGAHGEFTPDSIWVQ